MANAPTTPITVDVEDLVKANASLLHKFNRQNDAIRELQAQARSQQAVPVPPGGGGGGGSPPCQLRAFSAGDGLIGISWGTINNRQPFEFAAGGVPGFTIKPEGTDGFIYARAVFDLETLQCTDASVIVSPNLRDNTTTIAFVLIGTYKLILDGSNDLFVQGQCGAVNVNICDLDQT